MKYRMTFKDTDAYVEDESGYTVPHISGIPGKVGKFIDHSAIVTIEWDSMANTARVVELTEPDFAPVENIMESEALRILNNGHLDALGVIARSRAVIIGGSSPDVNRYTVYLYSDAKHCCTCPSFKYERGLQDGTCKHIRRALDADPSYPFEYIVKEDQNDELDAQRFHEWKP